MQEIQTNFPESLMRSQERLNHEYQKSCIDIFKQGKMLEQKYQYEQAQQQLKIQYANYMALMSCTVYQDSMGKMIFSVCDENGTTLKSKVLLNVQNYKAKQFVSFSPELHIVFEVSWGERESECIKFKNFEYGVETQKFLKALKARGVLFLVASRVEKKASEALIAYSANIAETYEIPYYHGWNCMSDGKWHFAKDSEMIMQEVERNAI